MRKYILLVLLLIGVCSFSVASAESITSVGVGDTAVDAEKDALRNAVENALGALIDSETLVKNNMVIQDNIYRQSTGFVRSYEVVDKSQTDSVWRVTVRAVIDTNPDSKLMNELTRLGLIRVLRNPKIAVLIEDYDAWRDRNSFVTQNAVVKEFLTAGFTNMVDVGEERKKYNNLLMMTADDYRTMASLWKADYLVIGKVFAENVGDVGKFLEDRKRLGIQSCHARVEARLYVAQTGQIIAADGKAVSAADVSEGAAMHKAATNAAAKMGQYLVEQILNYASGVHQQVELVVRVSDFDKLNRVKHTLVNMPSAKDVILAEYANSTGKFRLTFGGSPQAIYQAMQDSEDYKVKLSSMDYNVLVVDVY